MKTTHAFKKCVAICGHSERGVAGRKTRGIQSTNQGNPPWGVAGGVPPQQEGGLGGEAPQEFFLTNSLY